LNKLNGEEKIIKPIKILKNLISLVRFWFYKSGTKKTELNLNRKNQAKPVFVLK